MSMPPQTDPGWYPDPWGAAPMRYWDGVAWTSHTYGGLEASVNTSGPRPMMRRSATLGSAAMWCFALAQPVSAITATITGYVVSAKTEGFSAAAQAAVVKPSWYPLVTLASSLASLAALTAFVLFIIWAFRVAKNGKELGYPATLGPGWAIGGWFIPIANFVLPYLSIRGGAQPQNYGRVLRWWLAYISCTVPAAVIAIINVAVQSGASDALLIGEIIGCVLATISGLLVLIWGLELTTTLERANFEQ